MLLSRSMQPAMNAIDKFELEKYTSPEISNSGLPLTGLLNVVFKTTSKRIIRGFSKLVKKFWSELALRWSSIDGLLLCVNKNVVARYELQSSWGKLQLRLQRPRCMAGSDMGRYVNRNKSLVDRLLLNVCSASVHVNNPLCLSLTIFAMCSI